MRGRDYEPAEIQRRNLDVLAAAYRLGLIKLPKVLARNVRKRNGVVTHKGLVAGLSQKALDSLIENLPKAICQAEVAKQRAQFKKACRRLRTLQKAGYTIWLVTIANPNWETKAGRLTADSFVQVRLWAQRRARALINHGYWLMAGIVDISWNDRSAVGEKSYWQPHAHLLVCVKARKNCDVSSLLSDVFRPKSKSSVTVGRPVHVQRCRSLKGLAKAREYISSKLLAECRQQRNSYFDQKLVRNTRKVALKRPRFDELLGVIYSLGPDARWILGGVRRDGHSITRVKQSSKRKRSDRYYKTDIAILDYNEDDSYYVS